jgi:hypothetical protein
MQCVAHRAARQRGLFVFSLPRKYFDDSGALARSRFNFLFWGFAKHRLIEARGREERFERFLFDLTVTRKISRN